jgi:D-arabinose 1-dehydrogenase-like Zn-dependent alcohol dehydrogenase
MGSHQDMLDATQFIAKHKIVPVVSQVLEGLDAANEGFEMMKNHSQFGKIVVRIDANKSRL